MNWQAAKQGDEFTVPLCRMHHREVHRVGNEEAWWGAAGIDPLSVAQMLWKMTRVDEGRVNTDQGEPASASISADRSSEQVRAASKRRGRRAPRSENSAPV